MNKFNWVKRAYALFLLIAATPLVLPAQTFKTLHDFDDVHGSSPNAGLVQATDGNLYGTTEDGGANKCYGLSRCGTVFKIAPSGKLTTLYSFCSRSGCADGGHPVAELVQATDGNLYGTTFAGGANGLGTVFKITPTGVLTTLHSFDGTDGSGPQAGLVQATDGNLYRTTFEGGASGYGTAFKITPSGTLTTLHKSGCTDGGLLYAGLVQATNGTFYGTTGGGSGTNSDGTVFKITPSGTVTMLYSFCPESGCTDGSSPYAGLVQGTDGKFYGTTFYGGTNGWGTIFKITLSLACEMSG